MEIRYAILGFLSWQPFAGYDLKKIFAEAYYLDWSGNSNQIYKALVQLHQEGLVEQETVAQETYPPRKLYRITARGREVLADWVRTAPEPPQLRSAFLVQLAWADQLAAAELDRLLAAYEEEVRLQMLMCREKERRGALPHPARTPREKYLWEEIAQNRIEAYEQEMAWVQRVRAGVGKFRS